MDFKGITWAGDIYEKFEAMCLEVEEVMYEDTVKYVENQAEKVAVSVKKFYAEVMQDLLPPSCVGPIKVAELPPESYTLTDIKEKPKSTISDNCGELNIKRAVVADIRNLTAGASTPSVPNDAKHVSPTYPIVLVGKSNKSGLTRRSIGIKRISHPPKASRAMSSSCDTRSNCSVANDGLNVTTTSSEVFARHDPSEAVSRSRPISDAYAESLRKNNDATKCNSSWPGLPPTPIDMLRKDGSLSQINSNITETRDVGSNGEEATASYEDSFDIEVIEPDNILEPIEKSMLEESCILVEGDELHFVSRGLKKHKSYKKKIYDVLSLKLRSTKKQDLCVSEHDDLSDKNNAGATSSALAMDCDERKLPANSSCDFGWELL